MIYFIQAGEDGPIKIGYAKCPAKRLREFQCGQHKRLHLLGVIDGGLIDEAKLHRKFHKERCRGEWFEPSDRLLAFIDDHAISAEQEMRRSVNRWRPAEPDRFMIREYQYIDTDLTIDDVLSLKEAASMLGTNIQQLVANINRGEFSYITNKFEDGMPSQTCRYVLRSEVTGHAAQT